VDVCSNCSHKCTRLISRSNLHKAFHGHEMNLYRYCLLSGSKRYIATFRRLVLSPTSGKMRLCMLYRDVMLSLSFWPRYFAFLTTKCRTTPNIIPGVQLNTIIAKFPHFKLYCSFFPSLGCKALKCYIRGYICFTAIRVSLRTSEILDEYVQISFSVKF
jgi:hypothetical protein